MTRRTLLSISVVVGAAIALAVACAPSGFESPTQIDTVRILATRADGDKSFAHPGDTVTLEALTVDGRTTKTPPAVLYWIPFVCENPPGDLYYACFAPFLGVDAGGTAPPPPGTDAGIGDAGDAGSGDAGEAGAAKPTPVFPPSALAGFLTPGTDLTPYLPTGPFTLAVPPDIITRHAPVVGGDPYGLIVVFNIACAGRVKVVGVDPSGGPQQVPISCFDESGNQLGPDQYVIGFTREYVYETKTNANPEIDGILFDGVESKTGVTGTANPAPVKVTVHACNGSCDPIPLDMDVPQSSWDPLHKAIWVDYYASSGTVSSEARLLYDLTAGKVTTTANPVTYAPPDAPGTATIWAVVHDGNEGATWLEVDVTAK